jgi:tetratricopeptide (TPR) repeat protein
VAAYLVFPPDPTPAALAYRDDLPEVIDHIVEDCLGHWQHGDIDSAIQRAEEARKLAKTINHPISVGFVSLLLADLCREQDQLDLALEHWREAQKALRLQPHFEHRHHAEAVIHYSRGLLHHALGENTEAVAGYLRALTSLKKAVEDWNSSIVRDPAQTGKYKEQASKCEKAIKWINAPCLCLADDLSRPSRAEMHIPATDGEGYTLVRLELAAYMPSLVAYVRPQDIIINDSESRYQLHDPDNGTAFHNNLEIPWNAQHFAVYIPEDEWAGQQSEEGDYVLVKREQKETDPTGEGVFWNDEQRQWEYGTFTRNRTGAVTFEPLNPNVIGGGKIEDEDIGVTRALLKPV